MQQTTKYQHSSEWERKTKSILEKTKDQPEYGEKQTEQAERGITEA